MGRTHGDARRPRGLPRRPRRVKSVRDRCVVLHGLGHAVNTRDEVAIRHAHEGVANGIPGPHHALNTSHTRPGTYRRSARRRRKAKARKLGSVGQTRDDGHTLRQSVLAALAPAEPSRSHAHVPRGIHDHGRRNAPQRERPYREKKRQKGADERSAEQPPPGAMPAVRSSGRFHAAMVPGNARHPIIIRGGEVRRGGSPSAQHFLSGPCEKRRKRAEGLPYTGSACCPQR